MRSISTLIFLFCVLISRIPSEGMEEGALSSIVYKESIYHNNGKLCWKDPEKHKSSSSAGIVYYPDGEKCWNDPKAHPNSSKAGIIFDNSGKTVWTDPKVHEFSSKAGIVFHLNGEKIWKGPDVHGSSSTAGIIYHPNGKVCWKDPVFHKSSSTAGIIYYSNGKVFWKDPSVHSSGGKCYDSDGKSISPKGINDQVIVDLGDNCKAMAGQNGQFSITIVIGYDSYLVMASDATISIHQYIGSSLSLYMPIKSADTAVWLFDDKDNWLQISDR